MAASKELLLMKFVQKCIPTIAFTKSVNQSRKEEMT